MDQIGAPTRSGVGVPSLVRFATAHYVGAHCIILVSCSLLSAGCTCVVVLIELMTMGPAIVPQKRLVCQATFPRSWCCRRCCAAFVLGQSVHNFLLVAVSKVTEAVQARLAAISCYRRVVSFKAASARFSRAALMRSMAGLAFGITARAPPRDLPHPEALSWHWHFIWARQNATLQACHVRDMAGRPYQSSTSRGKC
jgi:hypothetical protein